MPNRVDLKDRHDVFKDDLNAISGLINHQIIRRHFSFLANEESYVIKGFEITTGTAGNSFNIGPGIGIDANGEIIDNLETIENIVLGDLTVGAINVVSLSYKDVPDSDRSVNPSPIEERVDISPRPQRGDDANDPSNEILPTRIYAGYNVHVDTLAVWNALSDVVKNYRIRLKKLVTPIDGVVDVNALEDPDFPHIVEFNFPDNSIPTGAIAGFDDAITSHQREAHVNFIYGSSSEVSFSTSVDSGTPNIVNVQDVDLDRSYYVSGKRFVRGDIDSFQVSFSAVTDTSGTYVIYVNGTSTTLPVFKKGIGISNSGDDMPIAVYQWDSSTGVLTFLSDIRNFLSVKFDNDVFSKFLAPLYALCGTGYFNGVLSQLAPTSSPSSEYDVFISPGYGIVRSESLKLGKSITIPEGFVLQVDPPEEFNGVDIVTLEDSGDGATSTIIELLTNGAPPHRVGTVAVDGLTEGTHYTVDRDAGTIVFTFVGLISIGSEVEISYTYGLPRVDLIALDYNDGFFIVKGISAQTAISPSLPSGSIEWGKINVRELATEYNSGDIVPGEGYKSLTLGFNYSDDSRNLKNRLGLPELVLDVGNPNGVTGETIPSTATQTINERLQGLEALIGDLDFASRPSLLYKWKVMVDPVIPMASFDPVLISIVKKFGDLSKDVNGAVRFRMSLTYKDNIPSSNPLVIHILVKKDSDGSLIRSFSVPTKNSMELNSVYGITTHATTYWEYNFINAADIRFEIMLNNAKKTKTNSSHSEDLIDISAELVDFNVEAWLFPEVGGI